MMFMGLLCLILAALIWSTTPIFSKVVYSLGMHPISLIEIRFLFGALFLILWKRPEINEIRLNLRNLTYLSVFGLSANYFFYHVGVFYTSASAAQVLESMAPIFVVVFAFLMKEEKISLKKVTGVLICVFGSALIFYSHVGIKSNLLGDALEVLAALSWGFFTVQSSRTLRRTSPLNSLVFLFLFSFIVFIPFNFIFKLALNFKAFGIACLMSFLHTFLAYLLYFEGIKRTSPTLSGVIFSLSPIFTIALSIIFLRETAGVEFYIGSAIAILGILIVIRND